MYRKGELSLVDIDREWPASSEGGGCNEIHEFCKDLSLSGTGRYRRIP